jgi:ligand-binding SRPBCC domain-containing protein
MAVIELTTRIDAPVERVFDLARDLDLHQRSMAHTNEVAVAGTTSGLIGLGETVTWRGRHFGVTQHFTSKITAFSPPRHFRDEMVKGAFKRFVHDHYFEPLDGAPERTLMRDVVELEAPLGILGTLAEKLVLKDYLQGLLTQRNLIIKAAAESPDRSVSE